jgi:hypothetical protein
MSSPVWLRLHGGSVEYFRHLPGVTCVYRQVGLNLLEQLRLVTPTGIRLLPLSSLEGRAYLDAIYPPARFEELTRLQGISPLGYLLGLSPQGILQVCIRQCDAFSMADDTHLADVRGRVERRYPCSQQPLLIETVAEALFAYETRCQIYAYMGPVRACMEDALQTLEYALFVLLTLRQREIPLTAPPLRHLYRPTILEAYKHLRTIVKGVSQEDYAKMSPADVRQFVRAGFLDLLTHQEAIELGFATAEEAWPREHGGRMRIGPYLDWLDEVNLSIYGTHKADRVRWRERLYDTLVVALDQAFQRYGPPKYPRPARQYAIADILAIVGLEAGYVSDIAERLRKRLPGSTH